MLIQRQGSYCGEIPVKLSLHSEEPGRVFVMVGNEEFRILLNEDEIRELHRLLGQFVSAAKIKDRL